MTAPYRYRIHDLQFNDGTVVPLSDLVLFVGANNSGKSRALKDILNITCNYKSQQKVVTGLQTQLPRNPLELETAYGIQPHANVENNMEFDWLSPTLHESQAYRYNGSADWLEVFRKVGTDPHTFGTVFGRQLVMFLTTDRRLTMVAQCAAVAREMHSETLLQALYNSSRSVELEIRAAVKAAFPEIEVALDFATAPSQMRFRTSSDFSALPLEVRDARSHLSRAEKLDEQGDGVRSYTGIVTALTTLKRPLVLIDEPEAFLHPPQAYRIGEYIAQAASRGNRQILVATHSADVVRGVLFNHPNTQVLRLDRIDTTNTVRRIDHRELVEIAKDPLLSAAGVLDGLFYTAAAITEFPDLPEARDFDLRPDEAAFSKNPRPSD